MTTSAFQYQGTHYEQLDGVVMGSRVSLVIADIFMEELEDKIFELKDSPQVSLPRLLKMFLGNIITVIRKVDGKAFLSHLNKQHPRIQFTTEKEEDRSLPFMNVRFMRKQDGTLARQIYQKMTQTNRYIQLSSHHPALVKSGITQLLTNCTMKVCSGIGKQNQEFRKIENTMVGNGHPRKFTQKAIS